MAAKRKPAGGKKAQLLSTFVGARLQEAPRPRRASRTQEVTKSTSQPVHKRATYYLRPEQIKALKLRAVTEERDLSEVVREAVDRYLGKT